MFLTFSFPFFSFLFFSFLFSVFGVHRHRQMMFDFSLIHLFEDDEIKIDTRIEFSIIVEAQIIHRTNKNDNYNKTGIGEVKSLLIE